MKIRIETTKGTKVIDDTDRKLAMLVAEQNPKAKYILDKENAIILINNDDKEVNNSSYIMIHERLIDDKLVEINRWYMDGYYFGGIYEAPPLTKYGLFKVQNNSGGFGSLYDYKNGRFVIPKGDFAILDFGYDNQNIDKYNGILGSFEIKSDYEDDNCVEYFNIISEQEENKYFGVYGGTYYAILNLDGTIRGNKLFKGDSIDKIEEIIDLNEYGSLSNFKAIKKKECNEKKEKIKQQYYDMLESRGIESKSPYLDSEVVKILKLEK